MRDMFLRIEAQYEAAEQRNEQTLAAVAAELEWAADSHSGWICVSRDDPAGRSGYRTRPIEQAGAALRA